MARRTVEPTFTEQTVTTRPRCTHCLSELPRPEACGVLSLRCVCGADVRVLRAGRLGYRVEVL